MVTSNFLKRFGVPRFPISTGYSQTKTSIFPWTPVSSLSSISLGV